jgi:N-acetylneuraminic acid mutarotase
MWHINERGRTDVMKGLPLPIARGVARWTPWGLLTLWLLSGCNQGVVPVPQVDPEAYLQSHPIEEDTGYLHPLATSDVIRINAGGPSVTTGGVVWQGDQSFVGGMAYSNTNVGDIANTTDDVLYVTERSASKNLGSFRYEIPVIAAGTYEVRLHLAEIYWGAPGGAPGGVGSRIFSAAIEGGAAGFTNYDIFAEVGAAAAVIKTYTVAVNDGLLQIDFTAQVNRPKVSAIEVILLDDEPPPPPPPPPAETLRINAGGPAVTTNGVDWLGDQYFVDGSGYSNPNVGDIANTTDDVLFVTERSASSNLGSFRYDVPVPTYGIYEVRLHFAEIYWGAPGGAPGGVGSRVFGVNIEGGAARLTDYDIYAEVGAAAAVAKTYEVTVLDGSLTLEFSATVNRPKLSAFEVTLIEEVEGPTQPSVTGTVPIDGATNVKRDVAVVADLSFPNGGGIDGQSLDTNSVRLYRSSNGAAVPGTVNTSGGNDSLVYQPSVLLDDNTQYVFEVTEALKDESGAAFVPYQMTFTTGTDISVSVDPRVTFERVDVLCCDAIFALAIGPDSKLYAAGLDGVLRRWQITATGALVGMQAYRGLEGRVVIGMAFDPNDDRNLFLWTTDNDGLIRGEPAEDFSGRITRLRLRGINAFEADMQDYVVGLPRSTKDHMTNNLAFGPDGFMYVSQGSNTGMGAPDSAWGNRPERLLTAAILRVDPTLPAAQLPIDVQTEAYGGRPGSYDPYAPGAPVQLFATGVRNAYDLVWHSNGFLYTPINGGNAGGKTPASPDDSVPAIENGPTQDDYLAKVDLGTFHAGGVQYYGHPNPLRGEYVLNGGNPTSAVDPYEVVADDVHDGYPVGVWPDTNFQGFAWNFGRNRSPNGIIEYRSPAFDRALQGKLLVVEYSAGKRIVALELDGAGNVIPSTVTQVMDGFTSSPLDLVEDPRNGNLYVAQYPQFTASGRVTLLRVNDGVSTNHPPVVDAGPDQSITWPDDVVTLSGSASDPDGDALTTAWSPVIAPGDVTFADASALTTTATFSTTGTYVLELSASDGLLTSNDRLTVEVAPNDPINAPPLVDAGPDLAITWPTNSVSLHGSASDPDGDALTITWQEVSGYGTVTFADPSAASTTATFSAPGTYVLELKASDGQSTSADRTTVTVHSEGPAFTDVAWSEVSAAPLARTEAQGAAVDGRLYVFGGYVSWDPYCTTTASHAYDPVGDAWSVLPDVPAALTHAGAVVVGSTIYLAGAYLNEPNCDRTEVATSTIWAFDTLTQTWSDPLPPLPQPRGAGGFARVGNVLHFFGGTDTARNDLADHWSLSLDDGTAWEPRASIPNPRSHLAAVEFGGKIYAIGGQHGHESHLVAQDSVHVYDPSTDSWATAASLPFPVSHTVASAFVVENRILVLGGEKGFGPSNHLDTVLAYDPATDTWTNLTPLPAKRNAAVAGVIGGSFYFTGGSTFTTNTYRGVPGAVSPNQPPTVDAGPDQTITLPTDTVTLTATASDDGLPNPPGTLTTTWSHVSGPTTATFTDPNALHTTATLTQAGTYVLRITAHDGELSASDDVTITVQEGVTVGTWATMPPSSKARQEVAYVQVGGKFYLAGGDVLHEVFDPAIGSWTRIASLPQDLDHIQGVTVGGQIYYVGGLLGWPGPNVDTVYIYDPAADAFTMGTPMPRGRGAGGVAVHDGKIYYAGGLSGSSAETAVAVGWFDAYDPATGTWTQLPDMPTARDHFHAAVVDGKFYAIGGRDRDINATTSVVEVFDFATGAWQTGRAPLPTPRGGFGAAVLGNEIIIFGGEGGGPFSGTFDAVEAYDTVDDTWRTLTPMPTARHGIQAAECNGGVYIAAGGLKQGHGPSTVHEAFFLDGATTCEAPHPVNTAPTVDAGPDQTITLPTDTVTLTATASDDGLPDPPGTLTTTWSQVSGPSAATITDPAALQTTATFAEAGTYVLRITAHDGELSASDDVTITVEPEPTEPPPGVDHYFTDFSEYTPGPGLPSDWSDRWVTSNWSVIEVQGEHALSLHDTAGSNRRFASWDVIDQLPIEQRSNAEILVEYSMSGSANVPVQIIGRGGGTGSARIGYRVHARSQANQMRFGRFMDGGFTDLGNFHAITLNTNTRYMTRFRINGNLLQAKTWLASDPEPQAWNHAVTDSSLATDGTAASGPDHQGWLGVGGGDGQTSTFYRIAVATGGGTASFPDTEPASAQASAVDGGPDPSIRQPVR